MLRIAFNPNAGDARQNITFASLVFPIAINVDRVHYVCPATFPFSLMLGPSPVKYIMLLTIMYSYIWSAEENNKSLIPEPAVLARSFKIIESDNPASQPGEQLYSVIGRLAITYKGHKPVVVFDEKSSAELKMYGFQIKNPDWYDYGLIPSNGNVTKKYKLYYTNSEMGYLITMALVVK